MNYTSSQAQVYWSIWNIVGSAMMLTKDQRLSGEKSMRWDRKGRGIWVCIRGTFGRCAIRIVCISPEKSLTCGKV